MKKRLLTLMIALVMPASAFASQSFDARSFAMGGIGASTASYLTAPLHNPALVAKNDDSDKLGILIPAIGFNFNDKDNMIEGLENMVTAIDGLDVDHVVSSLHDLVGDTASIQAGAAFAAAVPIDIISVNVFLQGYVDANVYSDIAPKDLDSGTIDLNNVLSKGGAMAVAVVDLGVALAKSYEFKHGTLYYGLTPKIQSIHTMNYAVGVDSFSLEGFDLNKQLKSSVGVNFDLGLAYANYGFTVALVGKNIIPQDYDVSEVLGLSAVYTVNPVFTASASFSLDFVTIGMDIDLNETKRFEDLSGFASGLNSDFDNTQMFGIGAEIDALGWAQIRAGYQIDMADNISNQFTIGIGISPFVLVSLDISGSYGGSNQFGGALQLSAAF